MKMFFRWNDKINEQFFYSGDGPQCHFVELRGYTIHLRCFHFLCAPAVSLFFWSGCREPFKKTEKQMTLRENNDGWSCNQEEKNEA